MNSHQRAEIRALIATGLDSKTIANQIGVPVQAVAAVRAHMKMGTYERTKSISERPITPRNKQFQRRNDASGLILELDRQIDALEKRIRDHIDSVLSTTSENYFNLLPSDIVQNVQQKLNEHLKHHPYEKRVYISNRLRLDYMDVMDYCKIILSNWNHFADDFGSKGEVEKHFLNVKEARNALKHGREINSIVLKQGEASVEWLNLILTGYT